jgi:phospholipase C
MIHKLLSGTLASILAMAPTFSFAQPGSTTTTPIKHIVVLFDENITFDHYFATYPSASNPPGEPAFSAERGTPSVNGLTGSLLTDNPNGTNPVRLDRTEAITCSNNHSYTPEQAAVHGGLLDNFVATSCDGSSINLNYYDGNTVTAMWNYAQRFALNDNSFDTTYGPSTAGAINLISGQTHALGKLLTLDDPNHDLAGDVLLSADTIFGDPDPIFDDCGAPDSAGFASSGGADNHNIGDLLNNKGITWGWFQGGFTPTGVVNGVAQCGSTTTGHPGILGNPSDPIHNPIQAYVPHHNPFMYYQDMANTHHLPPTSPAMVGKTDQAMHQYDLTWFFNAVDHNRMPAVSFLKAPKAMDGHPGATNSDPLSEQLFLVDVINHLQHSSEWKDTVVIIAYDDADGWYDHVNGPIMNHSDAVGADVLNGGMNCGTPAPGAYLGRCGYGARLPLLVISPWAKRNFVDHTTTDQTSVIRFIEDNWQLGRMDDLDHPGGTPPGQGSFDQLAGPLLNMFDFETEPDANPYILDHFTGEPADSGE